MGGQFRAGNNNRRKIVGSISPIHSQIRAQKKEHLSDTFSTSVRLCWCVFFVVCCMGSLIFTFHYSIEHTALICSLCWCFDCISMCCISWTLLAIFSTDVEMDEWVRMNAGDRTRQTLTYMCGTSGNDVRYECYGFGERVQCHFGVATKGRLLAAQRANLSQSNIFSPQLASKHLIELARVKNRQLDMYSIMVNGNVLWWEKSSKSGFSTKNQ